MSLNNKENISVLREYDYLIHLLRCSIHGDIPEELPEGMSFSKVYEYAMEHDMANLAFCAVDRLERKPDQQLYDTWKLRHDLALARDMNQEFARQELVDAFHKQQIPYKELQGTVLKKLYPRTEYRTMSDLDFIVESVSLEKCREILQNLGYFVKTKGENEVDGFRKPGIYVEIHSDYFHKKSDYFGLMELSFSSTDPMGTDALTELYLYTVLHTAKHYFAGGCGIRRVLDMYFVDVNYGDRVDRDTVDRVLSKAGLRDFANSLSVLALEWFGNRISGLANDAMEQHIFISGLHGTRENYISSKLNRIEKGNHFTLGTKVKYLFTRLFPGDEVMLKNYAYLRKYRILYPFCWIHRIFSMLLGRRRKNAMLDLRLVLETKKDNRTIAEEKNKL